LNDEILIEKINGLKIRLKEIILEIRGLKGQLEQSKISLEEFRSRKDLLETELRSILKKIAKIKDQSKELAIPVIKKEKPQEADRKQDKTAELIEKEIKIAEEIKALMQHFQIELDSSISKAKIDFSDLFNEKVEVNIDFSNYPERPIIFLPPSLMSKFKSLEKDFYQKISSYENWDASKPKKLYKLMKEILNLIKARIRS